MDITPFLHPPASTLPPGGSPECDNAFRSFLDSLCSRWNAAYVDDHLEEHHELPDAEPLRRWRLVNHVVKWAIGWQWPDGEGPNNNHRIRFAAVQWRCRRAEVEAEAERYCAEVIHQAAEAEAAQHG